MYKDTKPNLLVHEKDYLNVTTNLCSQLHNRDHLTQI